MTTTSGERRRYRRYYRLMHARRKKPVSMEEFVQQIRTNDTVSISSESTTEAESKKAPKKTARKSTKPRGKKEKAE